MSDEHLQVVAAATRSQQPGDWATAGLLAPLLAQAVVGLGFFIPIALLPGLVTSGQYVIFDWLARGVAALLLGFGIFSTVRALVSYRRAINPTAVLILSVLALLLSAYAIWMQINQLVGLGRLALPY